MRETRQSTLERRLERLGAMMQTSLRLDRNGFGYRVESANGSRDISPRLSLSRMIDWVEAGIAVMENLGRGTHGSR